MDGPPHLIVNASRSLNQQTLHFENRQAWGISLKLVNNEIMYVDQFAMTIEIDKLITFLMSKTFQ